MKNKTNPVKDEDEEFLQLEKYFPKGDKRRGEALAVLGEGYLAGERKKDKIWKEDIKDLIERNKGYDDLVKELKVLIGEKPLCSNCEEEPVEHEGDFCEDCDSVKKGDPVM